MIKRIQKWYHDVFGPSFQEAMDESIKAAAKLYGDMKEAEARVDFYSSLVGTIDPWKDHWAFAHARDKQGVAFKEHEALEAKHKAACAAANELIVQLTKDHDAPATSASAAAFPDAIFGTDDRKRSSTTADEYPDAAARDQAYRDARGLPRSDS